MTKSEDEEHSMGKKTLEVDSDMEGPVKLLLETMSKAATPAEALAILDKAKLSEKAKMSVRAALSALSAVKDELPEDLFRALAQAGGFGRYMDDEDEKKRKAQEDEEEAKRKAAEEEEEKKRKAKQDEEEEAKRKVKDKEKAKKAVDDATAELRADVERLTKAVERLEKERDELKTANTALTTAFDIAQGAKKPFMKSDGTPDFDAVPEEVRDLVRTLHSKAEDLRKDGDKKAEELKKAQEAEALRKAVDKAAGYRSLPIKAEEFGPLLLKIERSLDDKERKALDRLWAAIDKALESVFKNATDALRKGDDSRADFYTRQLELRASEIQKRDGITMEAAFVKAMEENPELAQHEREERDRATARTAH